MAETFSVTTSLNLGMSEDDTDIQFVGRVGQFTPVVRNGGRLLRKEKDGYSYVGGSKGYRWLETEVARPLIDSGKEAIDISYYEKLADDAIAAIEKFGSFEMFTAA